MRSEPVNDGPWTYERVGGRYLRLRAARSGGAPRGMAVVFPLFTSRALYLGRIFVYIALFCLYLYWKREKRYKMYTPYFLCCN